MGSNAKLYTSLCIIDFYVPENVERAPDYLRNWSVVGKITQQLTTKAWLREYLEIPSMKDVT